MRKSTLIWMALTIFCGAALFYTTQQVTDGRQQLASLQKNIQEEEETLRVMQAEWSYLNQPDRLEKLVQEHLGLQPMKPKQFVRIEDVGTPATAVMAVAEKEKAPTSVAAIEEKVIEEVPATPVIAAEKPKASPVAAVKTPVQKKPAVAVSKPAAAFKPSAKSPEPKIAKHPLLVSKQKPSAQQADGRDFNAVMKSLGVR